MSVIFGDYNYGSLKSFYATPPKKTESNLEFAHPVDSAVIKVLETAYIKNVFSEAVNFLVSTDHGLLLSLGIAINQSNFPQIYNILYECCEILSIPVPYTVVTNEVPGVNAMSFGTDSFSFIAISTLMSKLFSIPEQKFVPAHECGHIALGHMVYHTSTSLIANFGQIIPVIGPVVANIVSLPLNTWSRRSEITADRAGLICCGDLKVSQRALLRLVGGFTGISSINIDAYIDQSKVALSSHRIGKYNELFRSHPLIFKRLKALELFYNSELYHRITGKNSSSNTNLLPDDELNKSINNIIKII